MFPHYLNFPYALFFFGRKFCGTVTIIFHPLSSVHLTLETFKNTKEDKTKRLKLNVINKLTN